MRNNDLNVHVFENRNPSMYVHYLIDNFFSNFDCNKKREKIMGGTELFSEKTEAVHSELNERAKAATSSYYAAVGF